MALLISNMLTGDAETWSSAINQELPDLEVRYWPDAGDPNDVEYIAFGRPYFDDFPNFPNLKAMLTRQAGVDGFIRHPRLPKVPLGKLDPVSGDPMMTEYTVMHVLRLHRNMPQYEVQQAAKEWKPIDQVRPEDRGVGFLGIGTMAKPPAKILQDLGLDVASWTRTPKDDGIPNFCGADQFEAFLNRTQIAVCLLPLTEDTNGILCARTFDMMPKGAMIVNLGRGEHVVVEDLIGALDSGQLSYAALDAHSPEPLPPESPLWGHPKVTVMPHVARRPPISQLVPQIVENIRRFEAGESLLQEVDPNSGY